LRFVFAFLALKPFQFVAKRPVVVFGFLHLLFAQFVHFVEEMQLIAVTHN